MRCKLFIFRIGQTLKYRRSLWISILIKIENIVIYVSTYVRAMRMLSLFVIKSKSVLLTNYSVARFFYSACNYYWITLRCCVDTHTLTQSHTNSQIKSLLCSHFVPFYYHNFDSVDIKNWCHLLIVTHILFNTLGQWMGNYQYNWSPYHLSINCSHFNFMTDLIS